MALAAKTIIKRVALILKEKASGTRWKADELVWWLNDAQREIAVQRPDACAVCEEVTLAAGFRQQLPATAARLIDIPNNATGSRLPIRQANKSELDVAKPGWRADSAATVIKHFFHDPRAPRLFEVYPPADPAAKVDMVFSKFPDVIPDPGSSSFDSVTGNIGVPDIHANALVDYVLYRAFSKDSETTVNAARAQAHLNAFAAGLGIEINASLTVAPEVANPGAEVKK